MRFALAAILCGAALLGADARYDGGKVHYESYGTGPEAIVFIHGWTCDLTFWRGQSPVYEKRRSLLVDLPGHGQSDTPDVAYTPERFARAVEAVMKDAGVERAVLVGHSMGVPVTITFLRLFPEKTKALVMVDGALPATPPTDEAALAKQKAQRAAFVKQFREPSYQETASRMIETMFSAKTTPEQRDEIKKKMTATPQHVMASAMENMMTMTAPKAGEKYTLPALAIMAGRPAIAGYETRLRPIFPNLTYEEWQGSGHFLMMESPQRFNESLLTFLTK